MIMVPTSANRGPQCEVGKRATHFRSLHRIFIRTMTERKKTSLTDVIFLRGSSMHGVSCVRLGGVVHKWSLSVRWAFHII